MRFDSPAQPLVDARGHSERQIIEVHLLDAC